MTNLLQDGNLIEKSKALVWSRFAKYDSGELQLLEAYLSRINPRDPSKTEVKFTLSEYGEYMGISDLRASQVKAYTKHLLENVVEIPLETPNGRKHQYIQMTLFSWATCEFDDYLGQYIITIDCNPKLQSVFFDFAKGGYVQYRSRDTKKMRSKYSILLYCLLRDFPPVWEVPLSQLREQLGADDSSYTTWKDFRRWVLDPAIKEINSVSGITAEYTTISSGRKIIAVQFRHKLKPSQKTVAARSEAASAALPEHDGAWYADSIDDFIMPSSALKLAEAVRAGLHQTFRQIPLDQLDLATRETIKAAYIAIVKERDPLSAPIEDVGKVLWSVLVTQKGYADYVPATYTHPEFYR